MSNRKTAKKATRPLTDLLMIFAGPAIWFGHFSFIYGAETLVCLRPAASADQRMLWVYALATITALAGLALVAMRQGRKTEFLPRACAALALLSIAGVVWTTIPATFLPLCAGPNSHT